MCSAICLQYGQQSRASPGIGAVRVGVYWNSKLVCFVLPDGTTGRVIVAVDGVIEVHDALLAVPV